MILPAMKKTIAILTVLAAGLPMLAQNVNQTVRVTNEYESRPSDFQKKGLDMFVPDTLMVFDYKFDYSVFDSPYKGAYEFSPYSVRLTPDARNVYRNKLYVRFGAGYSFHPELDVDSEFKLRDNFSLSVFGTGRGYYGNYRLMDKTLVADRKNLHNGFDFKDNAGVSGRVNLAAADLTFEVGHDGVFAADRNLGSAYNSAYAKARIRSTDSDNSFFYYDFGANYRFGHDDVYYAAADRPKLDEHDIAFYGTLGPVLDRKYRFLADFWLEQQLSSGMAISNATLFKVTPRFEFELGPVSMSAGAKLDFNSQKTFTVYPDVRASAYFFKDLLRVYGSLSGDSWINTFHTMKERNHFFVADNVMLAEGAVPMQVSRERLKGLLGASAQFRHLAADLNLGATRMQNALADSWFFYKTGNVEDCYTVADYTLLHSDARASWTSDRFELVAGAALRHVVRSGKFAYAAPVRMFYAPALFTGDLSAVYNWNKRIYAGLWLKGSTARTACAPAGENYAKVPGWIEVGVSGRYVFSDKWSAWVQGGNLAMQSVRSDITHVQAGPYFTLGFTFSL